MNSDMKKGLISVVVPIYNLAEFLPKCLDSLLNQTFLNYEIILVDDGSMDESPSMCDKYAELYEKVSVVHKKNGGLSSARNAGILIAEGEYIIFPDPDDWVEKDYLSTLYEMQSYYNADLTCVGYILDFENGNSILGTDGELSLFDRNEAKKHLMIEPSMKGFAWNKLYKTSIIRENSLLFLDDVGTREDLDFAYRYINCSDIIVFSPKARLYHYFQRNMATTHGGYSTTKYQGLSVYDKMLNDEMMDYTFKNIVRCELCSASMNFLLLYTRGKASKTNEKNAMLKMIRKNLLVFLLSKYQPFSRKIQALICAISPQLYCRLRKIDKNGM